MRKLGYSVPVFSSWFLEAVVNADSAYLKMCDVRLNIIVCTSVVLPIKHFLHDVRTVPRLLLCSTVFMKVCVMDVWKWET